MLTKAASGVRRIGDDMVNSYVLVEGTDLTLVDAGLPAHYGRLTALLEGIGRSVRDVRAVLLTYAHLDHVGLAERLRQETGATVWLHECDVPAPADPLRPPADAKPEARLGRYLRHPNRAAGANAPGRVGGVPHTAITSTSHLEDDMILDVPGRPPVVAVPGHTPGSVGFHLPARSTAPSPMPWHRPATPHPDPAFPGFLIDAAHRVAMNRPSARPSVAPLLAENIAPIMTAKASGIQLKVLGTSS